MISRCLHQNTKTYAWYGARGVTVCERWLKFENFLEDMGERPDGLTLERRDNSMGYHPDNCLWADRKAQMRNTRYNQYVIVGGEKMCVADAATKLGVGRAKIYWPAHKYGLPHQVVVDGIIAAQGSGEKIRYKSAAGGA